MVHFGVFNLFYKTFNETLNCTVVDPIIDPLSLSLSTHLVNLGEKASPQTLRIIFKIV